MTPAPELEKLFRTEERTRASEKTSDNGYSSTTHRTSPRRNATVSKMSYFLIGRPLVARLCADCRARGRNYIVEDYVARKPVWERAWPGTYQLAHVPQHNKYFLCIDCLERRIGRKLTPADLDMRRMKNVARGRGYFHATAKLRRLLRRLYDRG
jgi:hypothetical protein